MTIDQHHLYGICLSVGEESNVVLYSTVVVIIPLLVTLLAAIQCITPVGQHRVEEQTNQNQSPKKQQTRTDNCAVSTIVLYSRFTSCQPPVTTGTILSILSQ